MTAASVPAPRGGLPARHILLAVAITAVWGTNFTVVKMAIAHMPPLLFAALRFTLAFLPAALFIKRPNVPWRHLAAYGLLIGAGQFGLMFFAMTRFISPGLASLLAQMQVFFTIGLAMWIAREKVRGYQIAALCLCAAGLALIITRTDGSATQIGVDLMLGAAFCWACGNLVARASGKVDMLGYVVWSSLFAAPALFAASLLFEGWPAISTSVVTVGPAVWLAIVYQAVANTLFGYAAWGWLLARHPTASIAPMSLLVPVFGMAASAFFLGETLPPWKLEAAALLLLGLVVNLAWPTIRARFSPVR